MAKTQGKKSTSSTRNPDRRNGKAWKKDKNKLPKKKTNPTAERVDRKYEILKARQRRKEENLARRDAEKAAAEALALMKAETERILQEVAEKEAAEAKRHDPIGVAIRMNKTPNANRRPKRNS